MPITTIILDHLRDLGWVISTRKVNGTTEYHAVLARDPDRFQVVRCNDGDRPEEAYRAACRKHLEGEHGRLCKCRTKALSAIPFSNRVRCRQNRI